jgi:hypothetical protein
MERIINFSFKPMDELPEFNYEHKVKSGFWGFKKVSVPASDWCLFHNIYGVPLVGFFVDCRSGISNCRKEVFLRVIGYDDLQGMSGVVGWAYLNQNLPQPTQNQ